MCLASKPLVPIRLAAETVPSPQSYETLYGATPTVTATKLSMGLLVSDVSAVVCLLLSNKSLVEVLGCVIGVVVDVWAGGDTGVGVGGIMIGAGGLYVT